MKRLSFIVLVTLGLSSCSYFSYNQANVLNSRNGDKLIVPSPLASVNLSPYYDLPVQNQEAQISLAPPS